MSLDDQFNLLVQGKRYLPEHISVPLVKKLRERIHRETGLEMLSSFVVRTPFPCADTRRALKEYIGQKLMSLEGLPSAYGAYIGDICRVVVQQLFKSFQLKGTTDYFFNRFIRTQPRCQCVEISEKTGVPLVDGHILTREFDWVTKWDPRLNPSVFQQCLKNMLIRPWAQVEKLLWSSLHGMLQKLTTVPKSAKEMFLAHYMHVSRLLHDAYTRSHPVTARETYVKSQRALMPPSLIAGWFDKGPTALWYACPNLFVTKMWATLFHSSGRFQEVCRANSPNGASTEVTRALLYPMTQVFGLRLGGVQPHSRGMQQFVADGLKTFGSLSKRKLKISESLKRLLQSAAVTAKRKLTQFEARRDRQLRSAAPAKKRGRSNLTVGLPKRRKLACGTQVKSAVCTPDTLNMPVPVQCMCPMPETTGIYRCTQKTPPYITHRPCHVRCVPVEVWREVLQYLQVDSQAQFFCTHPTYIQLQQNILSAGRIRFEWADKIQWWCRRLKRTLGLGRHIRPIKDAIHTCDIPPYPYTPQEVTRYRWLNPPSLPEMWDIFLHIGTFLMPYHQWRWVSTSRMGLMNLHMCLSTHTARPGEWNVTYFVVQHLRSVLLRVHNDACDGTGEIKLLPILHARRTHLLNCQRMPPSCDHCAGILYHLPVTEAIAQDTCPSPGFQYLYKFKSVEQPTPQIPRKTKFREVITYSLHPYPRVGKLIGQCLTQFWKLVIEYLKPRELLKMTDLLGFVRELMHRQEQGRRHEHCVWVELDLVEMFPNIPRHEIETALTYLHKELLKKMGRSSELTFFIAKGGFRRLDNCVRGDRGSFLFFTFSDVLAYTIFDMQFNTLFTVFSSVFTQTTGTPIGGSLSAQIASLVLIARELQAPDSKKQRLAAREWMRYRDNYIILMLICAKTPEQLQQAVQRETAQAIQDFSDVFGMELQVEQWGHELDFLSATLGDIRGETPIRKKSPIWESPKGAAHPSSVQRMIHPHAPNARQMVESYVPNEVRSCAHYRLTTKTALRNVSDVERLLSAVGYPPAWWKPLVRKHVQKWGL